MDEKSLELVIKVKQGNEAAFEQLFNLYKVKAVRTAYLITGRKDLAEDVTQETFIVCYKKIGELKDPTQFKSWFFKILTRAAWKISKKEKKSVPVENIYELADYNDIEKSELDFIRKEDAENLSSMIDELEEKQKTAITLYYYNGFSVAEIAKIMGSFEGTVKSRLYSARKNLKKSITEDIKREEKQNAVIYKI